MTAFRTSRARLLTAIVLGIDTALFVVIGFDEARGRRPSRPFHADVFLSFVLVAVPFAVALALLLRRPGVEGSGFARFMAWCTALALPLTMTVMILIGIPSESGFKPYDPLLPLLAFSTLQILVPASVRWAHSEDGFLHHYVRASAMLLAVFAFVIYGLLHS